MTFYDSAAFREFEPEPKNVMLGDMAILLVKNRIETYEQLHEHRDECQSMITHLCERREELKKQPRTESTTTELDEIREKLKVLRREVRLCGDIETDSVALQKKREALRELEGKEYHENERPPTSRSNGRERE